MKRGWLAALGVLVLVVGIALAAAGAFVAATVGSDDAVSTAPARVRGAGVAVVADDVRVEEGSIPVPAGVGSLTLSVRARDGREMFAGVAAPADVDHYLTGAPYVVVVDLSAGSAATTRAVPGTQQPPPPDSVRIWTASSRGAPAVLAARFPAGTTLVVMNADARPGVDADVVVTLRVPHAWVYAWVAVGVGVLLGVLGVVLVWRARAAGRGVPGPFVPAVAAVPVGATVLPGAAPGTAPPVPAGDLVPPAADLVAPASGALAALVVEAAGDASDASLPTAQVAADEADEMDVADDAWTGPLESDPADLDADADELTEVAMPEPVVRVDVRVDADPDAGADPVFAALVSAYGIDPVHDGLPTVPAVGSVDGGTDAAAPGPSGPASSDG